MIDIDKFLSERKLYNKKIDVLVIRLSSLGDVVLATSFVNALYDKYSERINIYFLTKKENGDILLNNYKIKKIFFFDKDIKTTCKKIKAEISVDFVFDISFTLKSLLLSLCFFKKIFIIRKDSIKRRLFLLFKNTTFLKKIFKLEKFISIKKRYSLIFDNEKIYNSEIFLTSFEILNAKQKIKFNEKGLYVGINTGASKLTKKWFLDRYIELIKRLLIDGINVLLFGYKDDLSFNSEISKNINDVKFLDLTNILDKREFFSIVSLMDVFFTTDSFGMHVAQAFKVPVVSVFGPTVKNFGFWEPNKLDALLEDNDIFCRPCSLHGKDFCNKKQKCMESLTVEKSYFYIKNIINFRG